MALVTINNRTKQSVPILVNSIDIDLAETGSDIPYDFAGTITVVPGQIFRIEIERTNTAQIKRIRQLLPLIFISKLIAIPTPVQLGYYNLSKAQFYNMLPNAYNIMEPNI